MKLIPFKELGHADHGWLNARHHFSFGDYYDPQRMGFGTLRVINDDTIAPGTGFAPHPHNDMEIITYVRSGAISHKDSNGNEGKTSAGNVQVMSAGSGIRHSEHNHENEQTTLYQIWITPNKVGVKPSWDSFEFPKEMVTGDLTLLVSGDGKAPLQIHQDAFIYAGRAEAGSQIKQNILHQAYVLVSEGEIEIEGIRVKKGDGLEIDRDGEIEIKTISDAEILLIDAPAE